MAIYGLQNGLEVWAGEHEYQDYHRYIDWRWLMMELSTLAVGAILLWRYRLPFLVMPIAVTLWYLSMDLTPFLFGQEDYDWLLRRQSASTAVCSSCCSPWVDIRTRHTQDYAFWLYLLGLMAFFGAGSAP